MSLKTCRILQTIAVILFALAFLFVLLSIPFKNTLLSLTQSELLEDTSDFSVFHVSIFPTINFTGALFYLALALIHFAVLKKPVKKYVLASVIICSLLFIVYKVFTPALNNYFSSRVYENRQDYQPGYYTAYALVENSLYSLLPFFTVPGSILMFLSLGGSIGKGAEEKVESAVVLPEAQNKPEAAEASKPEEPKSAAKKRIELPGLEEPAIDPEAYQKAFQRPSADAPQEASEADRPASDEPDAYNKAFQRPKNN